MKKFCLVMLLFVLAALLFPVTRNDSRTRFESMSLSEMKLHFDLGEFALTEVSEDGVIYTRIDYDGARTEKQGYAEIPFRSVAVQLSPDSNYDLNILSSDYEEIKLDHPLIPSRGVIYRNQDISAIPYHTDPASVKDENYPGKIAEMTDPFIFRDVRGTNVIFYPFQYNAGKKTLRIYRSITVGLNENSQAPDNPIKSLNNSVAPEMYEMYRSLFINYNHDSKFTHELGQMGEMLVIYTSRDASVIQPYIDWKREKGFKVHPLQVANGTNVKNTIQNAYNNNPNILYVQLVGGWDNIKTDTMSLSGNTTAPMDPMLGCVVGTDLYPDLIIGRFSARSTTEVTTQINKAISYEKNPDLAGTWYRNAMGMARKEGQGGGHHGGEADDYHMEVIRNNKLLPYNYSTVHRDYDGGSSYASNTTATQISGRINAGISLLNYANHGNETFWSVASYSNTHVNALSNGNKLPFVWSVACLVGKFNRTSACFAETWLSKQGGGAVGFMGSTINQPWIPPMSGQDYFNDLLIGGYNYTSNPGSGQSTTIANKRTTFGALSFNGMILMLSDAPTNSSYQETIRTWTLFGDASLQVRTDTPKAVAVSNSTVSVGQSYTTNIKAAGVNFQNALVSLYQNGNTFSGFTNSIGNVTINHNLAAGAAKLVVTGYNTETKYTNITVGGSGVVNPSNLSASTAGETQINLGWTKNASNNNVMVAFSTTGTFGTPSGSYSLGQTISGGGTVIYRSSGTSHSHTSLSPGSTYYYKAWSYDGSNVYSSGITAQGSTTAQTVTLPLTQDFNASTSLPAGWQVIDNQGNGQVWKFGTHANGLTGSTGNYANLNSDGYGSGNTQNTDLVTPIINMTGKQNVTLAFNHYYRHYSGSTATLSYSINGGSTWTQIQQWTVNTSNPAAFSQVISAVAGQSQVRFKWNFTGTWGYYWDIDDVSITGQDLSTPPAAETLTATSVASSGATLNGTVNANGNSTTVTFEYGTTTSYGNSKAATPGTVTGTTNTAVSTSLTGLNPGTLYYYRVKAVSTAGTTYGNMGTFTTSFQLPFAQNFNASTSLPAGWQVIDNEGNGQVWQFGTHANGLTGSTGNYANLNSDAYGSGNSQNSDLITPIIDMTGMSNVTLSFKHYYRHYTGSAATLSYSINGGSTWTQIQQWSATTENPVDFSQVITDVAGQSQVRFKWNYTGTWGYYWDVDDITIAVENPVNPPVATTGTATNISESGATLDATVNASGNSTTVVFEYGLTTSYGQTIAATPGTVTGNANTAVSANLTGLNPNSTYNFRVRAVNEGGTVYGSNRTFTTLDVVEPPKNLAAVASGKNVMLTWDTPVPLQQPDVLEDGFETYTNFALSFSPWTQIDGDGNATYTITDVSFQNQGYTGAYIIFNPSQTSPALTTEAWQPRTGSKYAACFNATPAPNNDWLITPQLMIGNGYNFSFYAKSVTDQHGLERFRVGVSATGTQQSDFTIVSTGSYVEAPTSWTHFSYDLSAYAGQEIHLAITCVSHDAFVFMVDDISVNNSKGEPVFAQDFDQIEFNDTRAKFLGRTSPVADFSDTPAVRSKSTHSGYKIYRNSSVVKTITDPSVLNFSDLSLPNGDYEYYVTATYTSPVQESAPSNVSNVNVSVSGLVDSFPWVENFEGPGFEPEYWSVQSNSSNTWLSTTGYTIGEKPVNPVQGSKFAYVNWHGTDAQNEWLVTPPLDFSSVQNTQLSFYFNGSYHWSVEQGKCMLKVFQKNGSGTWTEIWKASDHPSFTTANNYNWLQAVLPITGYSSLETVQLAFVYQGTDGATFAIDNVIVDGEPVQSRFWAESFEGETFVPQDWTLQVNSANTWVPEMNFVVGAEPDQYQIDPQDGLKFAYVRWHGTQPQNEWLITPPVDVSEIESPGLVFWFTGSYYWSVEQGNCMLKVMKKTGEDTWTEIWRASDHPLFTSSDINWMWLRAMIPFNSEVKNGTIQLAFVYEGSDGASFAIDNIRIEKGVTAPRNFAVQPGAEMKVNLEWNYVDWATSYNIYRSTDPYSGFVRVGSTENNFFIDSLSGEESNMHFYYLTAEYEEVEAKSIPQNLISKPAAR